jgi:sugar phosphate isomerase/epimerase
VIQLGIFAKTFARPDVDGCLRAVAEAGIPAVQFNLSVVGLPTIPTEPVPAETIGQIRAAAEQHDIELAAISGTFNAAHPDPAERQRHVDRFPLLCAAASELGIGLITLSSGSRDPDDMWRWHPDNTTAQAWADSLATLTILAEMAETARVKVAFEPEHSNVVATADHALGMLAEVDSPALGLVYDAANLLDPDHYDSAAAEQAISTDIAALGPHILLAHAKELTTGRAPLPAGDGFLPWALIVDRLHAAGFAGTLVTHGMAEADVPRAVQTLQAALDAQPKR